jgi:hypothetical protein
MGTTSLPPLGDETWAEQFTALLQSHRVNVREFLADRQVHLERAVSVLEEQIELLEMRSEQSEFQEGDDATLPRSARHSDQSSNLDWEAEKKRICAMLDGGLEGDEAAQNDQQLKIEDVLRTTDQILAEKDRDIQELMKQRAAKQVLEDDQEALEQIDVDKMLDGDKVIQEERQRLSKLQEQLQEKLRQAEVDLSMERAQLARLRAELEAKARTMESVMPSQPAEAHAGDSPEPPAHGRWLARLGLTDADREKKHNK